MDGLVRMGPDDLGWGGASPERPRRLAALVGAALLLLQPALGQAPDLLWEKAFGGPGEERGISLQETADGGIIVAGYTTSRGGGGRDLWLVKTDSEGELEWDRTIGGPGDEEGWAVLEVEDGYVVAGVSSSGEGGGRDLLLLKTYSDGYERWSKTFGGAGDDWGVALVKTEGGYLVAGSTTSRGSGGSDGWILLADPDGNPDWEVAIGGSKNDGLSSILEVADGYVAVGTTESYGGGGKDVWLVKTDREGARIWEKTFGKGGDERGNSVLKVADGYLIVGTTASEGSSGRDLLLLKTDHQGEKVWEETMGGPGEDGGWQALEAGGGLVVVGYTRGAADQDVWLLSVSSAGEKVWDATFGGPGFDLGRAIVPTGDGAMAMTGWTESRGSGGQDLWLGKTEAVD